MRTDKEQLSLIMEKKSVAEKRRRRNKKIMYSAFSVVLCLAVVLSAVLITGKGKNEKAMDMYGNNAPIQNQHSATNGAEKDFGKVENADGVIIGDAPADDVLTEEWVEDAIGTPGHMSSSGSSAPSSGGVGNQAQSGTLTGGEIKDNKDYAAWAEAAAKEGWTELGAKWQLSTVKRVTVNTSGYGGALVQLLDGEGKVLYGAVTNADGVAHLFVGEQDVIHSVSVIANGQSQTQAYSGTEYSFDMGNQVKYSNLDLMFVVDTTGSMGDELEYLKVEIADVINRISQNINVRTSVNFYRDEGDQYVVKYHAFNTDANAVQEIVKQQSADGGGDYEEAVHTALYNAVYDHAWETDSVKVMFIVLDAPPHTNDDVIASLSTTVRKAAEQGIRIVPVASSGIDKNTEGLLRSMALITGGTYTFLTDNSGVGNPHLPPSTKDYDVEYLNDMLVRIVLEYCGIKVDKNIVVEPNTSVDDDSVISNYEQ